MQGAPPLRVELHSKFSFLVWLFICKCVFIKLITCGTCSPALCPKAQDCSYGAFSLRFIHFSGKEACLNLSPYFLLNLAHSGHSGILAFGRLYPPHFWGKHWPPGAQSLAVRSHCSRLRSPPCQCPPSLPCFCSFRAGAVISLFTSVGSFPFCHCYFVASPEGFSPSLSPPVSSKT